VGDDVPTVFFLRLFYVNDGDVGISSKPVGELGISCVFCYSSYNAYYAPAPVGEAGALGGHRRLSSVCPSVCLMSRTSALTRIPKSPGRRNFAQGYPGHMRLPHRLQGQKVKSQGGAGAYCGGDLAAQLVESLQLTTCFSTHSGYNRIKHSTAQHSHPVIPCPILISDYVNLSLMACVSMETVIAIKLSMTSRSLTSVFSAISDMNINFVFH